MKRLEFRRTAAGESVHIGGIQIGYVDASRGFFTSPADVDGFVEISEVHLRRIADHVAALRIRPVGPIAARGS